MISIKVPPLGESIVEATIAKWLKQPGESVTQGETLVELETDKITVEVPAFKSGVLAKHLKNEGDVVKVDEVLGEMDASAVPAGVTGEATPANAGTATQPTEAGGKKTGAGAPPKGEAKKPGAKSEQPVAAQKEAKTSPAVRRIAAEESVDVTQVAGTGRDGRVTKPDMVVHLDDRKDGSAGVASSASGGGPPPDETIYRDLARSSASFCRSRKCFYAVQRRTRDARKDVHPEAPDSGASAGIPARDGAPHHFQ